MESGTRALVIAVIHAAVQIGNLALMLPSSRPLLAMIVRRRNGMPDLSTGY